MEKRTRYKICVSGAAVIKHCSKKIIQLSQELGKEIAKRDIVLVTGATTGVPFWVAKGAKEAEGIVVVVSPAASEKAHLLKYRLPVKYHDLIIFSGAGYAGRNLLLTRAADAIIICCGRMGTLNEFTIAFEDEKPIGVLEESGGTADMIREIVKKAHRGQGKIVYSNSPTKLIEKLIDLIEKEKKKEEKRLKNLEENKKLVI